MTGRPLPVAVVSALPEEMSVVRRRFRGSTGVALAVTGDGPVRALAGLTSFLERTPCAGVIGIGLAGAVTRDLEVGELVTARTILDEHGSAVSPDRAWLAAAESSGARACTVVSSRRIARSPREKAALAPPGETLPTAVDLESASWARAARSFGLPFAILRVISDGADDEVPAFIADSTREDGSLRRDRIVIAALANPTRVPALLRMARATRRASQRLADAVGRMTAAPGGV